MTRSLSTPAKAALVALALCLLLQAPAWAQAPARPPALVPTQPQALPLQGPKPVMENVFFNVVWGSAFGATLGVASAVLASEDRSSPENVRQSAFTGATAGGLIGLGLALYLVYSGITFDAGSSTIISSADQPPPRHLAQLSSPPISLLTAPDNPLRVTGIAARVLDFRF